MAVERFDPIHPKQPSAAVVVSDASFRSLIEYILRHLGLTIVPENDAAPLLATLQEQPPQLLLIESRLPDVDVASLCARIRLNKRTRAVPILVLAVSDDSDRQQLLECGADEYLSRPFTPASLLVTIRGLLGSSSVSPETDLLTFLDLELDLASYRVRRSGRIIHLAPTEFRLLHHLMSNPRKVHSRDELMNAAWPPAVHLGPRTVDVHIGRLRAALNDPGGLHLIRTVRSVGYALADEKPN